MHELPNLLAFCVAMPIRLQPALIPSHIDGFLVKTDLRLSRFSIVGQTAPTPAQAEQGRAELELSLSLRGQAHILVGNQRLTMQPQSMLWVRPSQPHLIIDASPDCLAWVIVFRKRLVRRVCTSPDARVLQATGSQDVLLRRLPQTEVNALSSLYAGIPIGAGRDVFNAGLGYALARSYQAFQSAPAAPNLDAVHPAVRAAAWLLRDGQAGLSNEALAARVGLSAQRLSRLFKAQTGSNLADFRNRQRIAQTVARLAEGERNLTGLALDAGFGSYSQFHRVFKQHMGQGPAAYLRQLGRELRHRPTAKPVPP